MLNFIVFIATLSTDCIGLYMCDFVCSCAHYVRVAFVTPSVSARIRVDVSVRLF